MCLRFVYLPYHARVLMAAAVRHEETWKTAASGIINSWVLLAEIKR